MMPSHFFLLCLLVLEDVSAQFPGPAGSALTTADLP